MTVIERCPKRTLDEMQCVYPAEHGGTCSIYMPGDPRGEACDRLWADYRQLQGAVSLIDAEWERVLWWLHKPVPPGPEKAMDEKIIRAINVQRGQ